MNLEVQLIILQIAQIIQEEVPIKTGLLAREVVLPVHLAHQDQEVVDLQVRVDQVQVEGQALQEDSHESLKNLV